MKPTSGGTKAKLNILIFFQKVARSFKIPPVLLRAKARSERSRLKNLDDCSDDESLTSTLVCDDDGECEKKYDTDIFHGEKSDPILDIKQCTPAPAAKCLIYAVQLASLEPASNGDAILDILDKLLLAFPCPHHLPIGDTEDLFREILRLASTFDNALIKEQALHLIIIQVRSGSNSVLVKAFRLQDDVRCCVLLLDLMKCLPDCWMEASRTEMHRAIQPLWYMDLPEAAIERAHAATPFVKFLLQLITSSQSSARAVFNAGFVDMVICMCTTSFPDPRTPKADTSRWNATSYLVDICASALEWLLRYPDIRDRMATKWRPLAECWPKSHSRSLANLEPMPSDVSRIARHRMESFQRIRHLSKSLHDGAGEDILRKDCAELLHLSRRALHDADIVDAAIRVLLDYICNQGGKYGVWVQLRQEIIQTPYHIIADLFFDMVGRLLSYSQGLPITNKPLACFLDFVDFVSGESVVMKTALEEAGVEALGCDWRVRVVPVVSQHSRMDSLQSLDRDFMLA